MREFPESVNERIWETASSTVLSGPSSVKRCPFTFVTSCQKTHRDEVRGRTAAGTCRQGWVCHHFAAKTVAPFRQSFAPLESRRYPCSSWKKKVGRTRKRWFDNRSSSHRNNFPCPTQIRRLLHFLKAYLRTQASPHQLFFFERGSRIKRVGGRRLEN